MMKALLFLIAVFICISGFTQQDSIDVYWNNLRERLLKRADVARDFADEIKASGRFVDTALAQGVVKIHERLKEKLTGQRNVDSIFLKDVKNENDRLIGYLGRLMVQLENDTELKGSQKFRELQASIMNAENRIRTSKNSFNKYCGKINRFDLIY